MRMARLHQDEHHQEIMEQLTEVYKEFCKARTTVSRAYRVLDDTQAERYDLQRCSLSSSCPPPAVILCLANEDTIIVELDSRPAEQEETDNH